MLSLARLSVKKESHMILNNIIFNYKRKYRHPAKRVVQVDQDYLPIRYGFFTENEEILLDKFLSVYKDKNEVNKIFPCRMTIQIKCKTKGTIYADEDNWRKEEIQLLTQVIVNSPPDITWKEISENVPDRTHLECKAVWTKIMNEDNEFKEKFLKVYKKHLENKLDITKFGKFDFIPKNTKDPWSQTEISQLYNAIYIHGTSDWKLIGNRVSTRLGNECKERWVPNRPDGVEDVIPFSEDEKILYIKLRGNNKIRSIIKNLFPGRMNFSLLTNTPHKINKKKKISLMKAKRTISGYEDEIIDLFLQFGNDWDKIHSFIGIRTPHYVHAFIKEIAESDDDDFISQAVREKYREQENNLDIKLM